ncbi:MAG: hypothetical protein A3F16_02055 [Deltaproteobacteria bacterium RIFCSPHIGHO2_12_FULL_43_9]|nr:MAG: hypothetical protein A3F16_02055 [Deltaproteobacteria bacterium RIFCSPHIGHO2_12_FULL_43_9]
MKTKFSKFLILFFISSLAIVSCGDDKERTIVNPNTPGYGTDNVFRGLPQQGITVGLPAGARLRKDDGTSYSASFSMTIAPNSQFVMANGVKYVPSYWTYPTHPGPLDFYAVSENEYRQADLQPYEGVLFPWARARYVLEGHGSVTEFSGRYLFQGEIILYHMQAPTDFNFTTGSFGLRISFGGVEPPQRIGTIR